VTRRNLALAKLQPPDFIRPMPKTSTNAHAEPHRKATGASHAAFRHVSPPARFADVLKSHGHTEKSVRALRAKVEQMLKREHAVAG